MVSPAPVILQKIQKKKFLNGSEGFDSILGKSNLQSGVFAHASISAKSRSYAKILQNVNKGPDGLAS